MDYVNGKVKVDLHNHLKTRYNVAEAYTLDEIVELGRNRLGKNGVLGIVNFADKRYEQIRDLPGLERKELGCGFYVPEKNFLVVKGEEVPTRDGHVLVFGIPGSKHITLGRTLSDTIKEVKDHDGIIIADHPFVGAWSGIGSYLETHREQLSDFDAIEVFNGEAVAARIPIIMSDPNQCALNFYEQNKRDFAHLGATTTSDGHSTAEIGRSYTNMQMPENYQTTFLDANADKDTLTSILRKAIRLSTPDDGVGRGSILRALLHTGVVLWDHKIKNGDPTMKIPKPGSFDHMVDDVDSRYFSNARAVRDDYVRKHQEALENHGLTVGLRTKEEVIKKYLR